MDSIFIEALEVETVIGVYDWEKNIKQTLLLDIELFCDISDAAESDDLAHALDYTEISRRVTKFLEQNHFQLIETAAEKTAQLILNDFQVPRLRLKISKPSGIKHAASTGVIIKRSQR